MAERPEKSRTAKTGSNVKAHKALVAHYARANTQRLQPIVQLRKQVAREHKTFLTRNVRRAIDDVRKSSREAFNLALIKAKGDGAAIARARRKARAAKDLALAEKIPGFAAFQAAQIANAGRYKQLVAQQRAAAFDSHVDLSAGGVASDALDFEIFKPRYELYDVVTPGAGGDLKVDGTVADSILGIVLNQWEINWDNHEPFFGAGFNRWDIQSNAAVGLHYVVPKSGRISWAAVVQNIYNYMTYSLTDNYGFSSGEIYFRILLFMSIVRRNEIIMFDRLIHEGGIVAYSGDDFHAVFDSIDMSTPFTFSSKTEQIFEKDEIVQLLVGSRLEFGGYLNDMQARLNGTIGWQVKEIHARTR